MTFVVVKKYMRCMALLFLSATNCGWAQTNDPLPGSPGYEPLARAFHKLKFNELDEAMRHAEEAQRLAPSAEAPVRLIVDLLSRKGKTLEALSVADAYIAHNTVSAVLLTQRGYLRLGVRDFDGASSDFRQSLARGELSVDQTASIAEELRHIPLASAFEGLKAGKFEATIDEAKKARTADEKSEAPVLVLIDAYAALSRQAEALAEADRFISKYAASARLRGQRGYLRRSVGDLSGAIEDFKAALSSPVLGTAQAPEIRAALEEATAAASAAASSHYTQALDRAYQAAARADFAAMISAAKEAHDDAPQAEAPVLVLMEALQRSGRAAAAAEEASRFIRVNKQASAAMIAQRGFLRRSLNDLSGAIEDFQRALSDVGLDPAQARNVKMALAEARGAQTAAGSGGAPSPAYEALDRAYRAISKGNVGAAVQAAREAREKDPTSEAPLLVLIDALTRAGQRGDALREADYFIRKNSGSGALFAQRGYLRRQSRDLIGAIGDFKLALHRGGLNQAQKRSVGLALREAQYSLVADQAYKAMSNKDWTSALRFSHAAQRLSQGDEAVFRVSIEALAQTDRKQEALSEADALIARGQASGLAYAQRAYLRQGEGDHFGAAEDFAMALTRKHLAREQVAFLERSLASARAADFESKGDPAQARSELEGFTQAHPEDADGWSALGSLYVRQRRHGDAVAAFERSVRIRPRGEDLLNAGYASVYVDRSKESHFFREALDGWSSDHALSTRPAGDKETIRNQIVEADSSVRTNVVIGDIVDRPKRWGGRQVQPSFETAIRFDGRHLPYIFGLEAFVGGFWSQDQTRFTESYSRGGLRLRPFDGINFNVSAEWQHHFIGGPYNQVALSWGYGYGGFAYSSAPSAGAVNALQPATIAYPYETGWQPLTSFAAYGTYRTGERRYLQNVVGLAGYTYWDSTNRLVIGPTAMASAGYDSADSRRFAFGVGPGVVFRAWLGGDKHRAYDGLVTVQAGYLFPFGESLRQGGLVTNIAITF